MEKIISLDAFYQQVSTNTVTIPILKEMSSHLSRSPGITCRALAKALDVDGRDLSGSVRLLTGMTLDAMLKRWHMMKALDLLRNTDYDYKTIARICGYSQPKNLERAMKRELHMTPYEYRNGYRRGVERPH